MTEGPLIVTVRAPIPCHVGFALESLELVEASIEPGFVHAYTLRCRAFGNSVTTRSEPMRFPVLPSDLGGPG